MDEKVHGDEDTALSMRNGIGIPAIAVDSDVMVPVEEDELLFPEDDKQGV